MDSSNEIDAIVDQLRGDATSTQPKPTVKTDIDNLTDDNVSEYVYKKTAEVIEVGLEAVNNLKDMVTAAQDPKEMAAFAQMLGAVTKAIDNLNKINLQTKQHKNNLEVARVEASGQKALPIGTQTNNIMIATRDEVMNRLFDRPINKKEKIELIEGDFSKDS
jgi:hypothetical protein